MSKSPERSEASVSPQPQHQEKKDVESRVDGVPSDRPLGSTASDNEAFSPKEREQMFIGATLCEIQEGHSWGDLVMELGALIRDDQEGVGHAKRYSIWGGEAREMSAENEGWPLVLRLMGEAMAFAAVDPAGDDAVERSTREKEAALSASPQPEKAEASVSPQLESALLKLANEVQGVLGLEEAALRALIGNTNVNVLKLRLEEARAALSASPVSPPQTEDEQIRAVCVAAGWEDEGSTLGLVTGLAEALGYARQKIAESASPQQVAQDWQPIETAPKDGSEIIVYSRNRFTSNRGDFEIPATVGQAYWKARTEYASGTVDEADWCWSPASNRSGRCVPDGWMPLPSPPPRTGGGLV